MDRRKVENDGWQVLGAGWSVGTVRRLREATRGTVVSLTALFGGLQAVHSLKYGTPTREAGMENL